MRNGFLIDAGRGGRVLRTSGKAAEFTESVIRETFRLAAQHGAINLGQGFPDFPCPPELKAAACAAIAADDNQYPMTFGTPALRAAIAREDRADLPGLGGRSRDRGVRHLRGHRGAGRGDVRAAGPRRRDRAVRALVRELPAERDPLGRGRRGRCCCGSRTGRSTRPSCGRRSARAPKRCSSATRTTRPARSTGPTSSPAGRAVRALGRRAGGGLDLRAHPPARARRLPAACAGAGPRGPDGHGQRAVEDLRGDRLAGGLDGRPAGDHRGDPQGARLPDDRRPGAPAGGGGRGARPARRVLHGAGRAVPRAPRPALRRAGGASGSTCAARTAPTTCCATSAASPPTATASRSPVG